MKRKFVCTQCGYKTSKWFGKCISCGAYGAIEELNEKKDSVMNIPEESCFCFLF